MHIISAIFKVLNANSMKNLISMINNKKQEKFIFHDKLDYFENPIFLSDLCKSVFIIEIKFFIQCGDASHDSFKGDTEISYIETP